MVGFEIRKRTRSVSPEIALCFSKIPVANISDMMSRLTAGGAQLRPFHDGGVMCGPALTVKTRPGDNLMVHKAIELAAPGDVIVVDAGGDLTNAIIGELMTSYAASRKLGGFVINGAIRDVSTIGKNRLPVFAAGVTHRGPYKDGPGAINVPVALNGMCVEPGDLIIGDGDGLLCVPYDQVGEVLALSEAKNSAEEKTLRDIAEGSLDISWIDEKLRVQGCAGV